MIQRKEILEKRIFGIFKFFPGAEERYFTVLKKNDGVREFLGEMSVVSNDDGAHTMPPRTQTWPRASWEVNCAGTREDESRLIHPAALGQAVRSVRCRIQ